jgi:hypothetical protein
MSSLIRSPVSSHDMVQRATPAPFYILISRDQYSSCHVSVPEMEKPLAAIEIGDTHYSFFTAVADSKRVLGIAIKLSYMGDAIAITKIAKGYAVWVLEPDTRLLRFQNSGGQPFNPKPRRSPTPTVCRVLLSPQQYRPLNIWVPDLDQPLSAIEFEGKYYSIFRVEADVTKLLEIAAKIMQRGDEIVMTKTEQGQFAICIWEPEGYLNPASLHP